MVIVKDQRKCWNETKIDANFLTRDGKEVESNESAGVKEGSNLHLCNALLSTSSGDDVLWKQVI